MILALSPFVFLALCATPLALTIGARFGARLGAAAALVAIGILLIAAFLVGFPTKIDPLLLTIAGGLVLGIALIVPARRAWRGLPSRTTRAVFGASLLAGVLWFTALAVASVLPHGAPLSWAMAGDSANQVHLLQDVILDSGLNIGRGNIVPLPSIVLALGALPGRAGLVDPELLAHDISALATVWSVGIAATGVLLGLVISSLLGRHRPLVAGTAAAVGSTLALSWYVLGLPIDSGYLNVHIALPLLLATWLVITESRRSPVAALAILLGISILLFATWSPLVLFPLAAAVIVVVRGLAALRAPSIAASVVLVTVTMLFLGWLIAVIVPGLLRQMSALAAEGHGFPPTVGILVAALVVAAVLATALRAVVPDIRQYALALAVSAVLGYLGLLYFARDIADPVNAYYVAKYSWLASVLVGAVALALLLRWAADTVPQREVVVVAAATTAGVLLASLGPMPLRNYDALPIPPLARVLDSRALGNAPWSSGDRIVDFVIDGLDSKHPGVYWDSAEPDEAYINFWLLLFEGGEIGTDKTYLRSYPFYSYRALRDNGSFSVPDIEQLCNVLGQLGDSPVVYTADTGLESTLATECPELGAETTVRVIG